MLKYKLCVGATQYTHFVTQRPKCHLLKVSGTLWGHHPGQTPNETVLYYNGGYGAMKDIILGQVTAFSDLHTFTHFMV